MCKQVSLAVLAWLIGMALAGAGSLAARAADAPASVARAALQEGGLDVEALALVEAGIAATAGYSARSGMGAGSGALAEAASDPASEAEEDSAAAEPTPTPEEEPAPAPEPAEPEAEPDAEATPVAGEEPAAADPSERVQYQSEGISLQAPVDWQVEEGFGTLFAITVPGTNFVGEMQDSGDEFPGVMGVVLIATLAEEMLVEYMEGAELVSVERGLTSQGLPMAKIDYTAEIEGVEGAGAFYIISPGASAYLLFTFAPTDEWETLAPGVAAVADSISFEDELITLQTATEGELPFGDEQGVLELVVPAGWHVTDTFDPTLPVIVSDPEFNFVGAVGSDATFVEAAGIDTESLFDSIFVDGQIEQEALDEAVDGLAEGFEGSGLVLDEEMTATYPRDGAVTIRVAGAGEFEEGINVPMVVYFDLRQDGASVVVVFGDADAALAQEEALLEIIQSVSAAE
jgi:hypothetical protein